MNPQKKLLVAIVFIVLVLIIGSVLNRDKTPNEVKGVRALITTPFQIDAPKKTEKCVAKESMPDYECTPGAVTAATRDEICTSGYSSRVRDVSAADKKKIYAAYGITTRKKGEYQVDHHISLELGGSNEFANLWPEAALPKPGYHEKDKVENYLHKLLCNGAISVPEAQQLIGVRWKQVYELIRK